VSIRLVLIPSIVNPSVPAVRLPFATLAIQQGVDAKTVSSILGHYSAGFTLDTYAHVTTQAQRQAANTMANILSGAVEN